jgi:hypothetical protein
MSPKRPGNSHNDPNASPPPTTGSHGFTLQPGGRNAIAGTAERIGSAVGSAHRQVRRGIELVRPSTGDAIGSVRQPNPPEQDDLATRMMQAIEEEIAEARLQAAHRLGQFSGLAGDRLQQLRDRLRETFSRSRRRARQLAAERPAQIIAAVTGFCLVFGATLLLRNSRRR